MGSSRSHAADMEDETKTCRHGVETKYFDTCRCDGCKADREIAEEHSRLADSVRWAFLQRTSTMNPEQRRWYAGHIRKIMG